MRARGERRERRGEDAALPESSEDESSSESDSESSLEEESSSESEESDEEDIEIQEREHFKISINQAWAVLNKYYKLSDETPVYRVAVVLHPRFKIEWFRTK